MALIETRSTSVEFSACLTRNAKLLPQEQLAFLTIASALEDPVLKTRAFFSLFCLAQGRLSARLGTLCAGEAITGTGVLAYNQGQQVVLIRDVVMLEHNSSRIELTPHNTPYLLFGRNQVRVRGMLCKPPVLQLLESDVPVCNARLALKAAQPHNLQFTELSSYGLMAEVMSELPKGQYVEAWGPLKYKRGGEQNQLFARVNVKELEVLHETRAFLR